MFGVSIMMTLITTVLAPPILVKLFDGGPGVRGMVEPARPHREIVWASRGLAASRLDTVVQGIVGVLRQREDCDVTQIAGPRNLFLVSAHDTSDDFDFQIAAGEDRVEIHADAKDRDRALGILTGALQIGRSTWENLVEQAPGVGQG